MRAFVAVIMVAVASFDRSPAAEPPSRPYDLADVAKFVEGEYVLIGRRPGSDATYTGRLVLRDKVEGLDFTRTIGGDRQTGRVVFDTKADESGKPVLKIRFSMDGQKYEATYLWHTDLSNFARLTGYVYLADGKTKFPGLEALFPLADYNRNIND
ncbi:MAG TPA: hypothetical protein VGM62_01215 [Chthoniobacterales bacterium]|jgi:hypothetical protein